MKLVTNHTNVNWVTIYNCTPEGLKLEYSSFKADIPEFMTWGEFGKNMSVNIEGSLEHQKIYFTDEAGANELKVIVGV